MKKIYIEMKRTGTKTDWKNGGEGGNRKEEEKKRRGGNEKNNLPGFEPTTNSLNADFLTTAGNNW